MSTMQEASAQAVAEVKETELKTIESLVKETPQPAPRRMSGPISSSHTQKKNKFGSPNSKINFKKKCAIIF